MNPLYSFNPIQNPNAVLQEPNADCLLFEPVLVALNNLLTRCLCNTQNNGIANLIDQFLRWFTSFVTADITNPFPIRVKWPRCLCNGGPNGNGMIRPASTVIVIGLRQIAIMIRNINNPEFWAPAGSSRPYRFCR